MRSTIDRITRRDALKTIGAGAALAVAAQGGRATADDEKRPPARIYVTAIPRRGEEGQAGPRGILAIDPKEGTWVQVAPEPFTRAVVAPDGRSFLCTRGERLRGIWYCEGPGEPPKKIADDAIHPVWSPDGKQIVATTNGRDGPLKSSRMNRDGTGRVDLPLPEGEVVSDWSRDGAWFLTHWYSGEGADRARGRHSVGLTHPDGTGRRLLIHPEATTFASRFAPDGRTVLFVTMDWEPGKGPRPPFRVERIGLDGRGRTVVLEQEAGANPYDAVPSPDGKELAARYLDSRREEGEDTRCSLVITDADGKNRRKIDALEGTIFLLDDWR
jgi:Tol biopolymer transport system component